MGGFTPEPGGGAHTWQEQGALQPFGGGGEGRRKEQRGRSGGSDRSAG